MKLLLVSNFYDVPNEHYVLNLLFCEGLETFHLRKKDYSEEQMRSYIERIPSFFHERIILHSHFHLIEEYELKGAHFAKKYTLSEYLEENQPTTQTQGCLFESVGFSFHTINEIQDSGNEYDYIFLSPIFDSISNKGYNSKFRLNDLKQYLQNSTERPKVIALGGINDTKVEMAHNLGFDGIALLGYIWTNFETDQDLYEVINKFNQIKKHIHHLQKEAADLVST